MKIVVGVLNSLSALVSACFCLCLSVCLSVCVCLSAQSYRTYVAWSVPPVLFQPESELSDSEFGGGSGNAGARKERGEEEGV